MRKIAMLLAVVMLLGLALTGCNGTTGSSAPQQSSAAGQDNSNAENPGDNSDPYANIDLGQEEKVVVYVTASEPNAMAEVLKLVNEKTKAAINTTMELYFIPSSERTTKYPLVMAGGDQVDLIYTANWCYYYSRIRT